MELLPVLVVVATVVMLRKLPATVLPDGLF